MKNLALFSSFLLLPFLVPSKASFKQTMIVSNIAKKGGTLFIGWYNNAADFREPDKAVMQKKVPVGGRESVAIVFDDVPQGTYAVAIFLDENDNGKMDTNFFGIPKERYGFSNNVYPMMRAATFKESSFVVEKETSFTIKLK
ncbi:MAG: DUF2141 domain-containing protein [Chitinophagaceae bacterium]